MIKRKVICKSGKKEGVVFMHGTITLCPFARKLANLITL
jgi:predicted metal-binding transcription factor (methanogenesis marker protein 9)